MDDLTGYITKKISYVINNFLSIAKFISRNVPFAIRKTIAFFIDLMNFVLSRMVGHLNFHVVLKPCIFLMVKVI